MLIQEKRRLKKPIEHKYVLHIDKKIMSHRVSYTRDIKTRRLSSWSVFERDGPLTMVLENV